MRIALTGLLLLCAANALASEGACRIAGKAYDFYGKPSPASVVRLTDAQTHKDIFRMADSNARFEFDNLSADEGGQRYRLDMLSAPEVVTGTHIRTRSIVGMAPTFSCSGNQTARVDVKAEVR